MFVIRIFTHNFTLVTHRNDVTPSTVKVPMHVQLVDAQDIGVWCVEAKQIAINSLETPVSESLASKGRKVTPKGRKVTPN